jgi:hypothetical protein
MFTGRYGLNVSAYAALRDNGALWPVTVSVRPEAVRRVQRKEPLTVDIQRLPSGAGILDITRTQSSFGYIPLSPCESLMILQKQSRLQPPLGVLQLILGPFV